MQVKDVMTREPACCTPDTDLQTVAQMMVQHDCGCIPVVESRELRRPVGVVTDRDIAIRAVAEGQNPLTMTAGEVMTQPAITVRWDADLDECTRLMEAHQIRRVVVIDSLGGCAGIVAQADIARKADEQKTAEVVKEVSQPEPTAAQV